MSIYLPSSSSADAAAGKYETSLDEYKLKHIIVNLGLHIDKLVKLLKSNHQSQGNQSPTP